MRVGLIFLFFFTSCAYFSEVKKNSAFDNGPEVKRQRRMVYDLNDQSGKFRVLRESGRNGKKFIVKRKVLPGEANNNKILEKSVTISKFAQLKNKIPALRPERSQFTVWFSGKKYFTEMNINTENRMLEVSLSSPEKQWKGKQEFPIPSTSTGIFCFYSQLIECAGATGFLAKAIKKGTGQMNFYIIMDRWPYFNEQYDGIPETPFVSSSLEYDGGNARGENRFSLRFGNQVSFYLVDKKNNLKKHFWIGQGLSMVERKSGKM